MVSDKKEDVAMKESFGEDMKRSSKESLKLSEAPCKGDNGKKDAEPHFEAPDSNLAHLYPWNYEAKWPLTRAERLKELDELSLHYNHTLQKENLKAAKARHSKFPPDQLIPDDRVYFQQGSVIEESEVDGAKDFVWVEGGPVDDFVDDFPAVL